MIIPKTTSPVIMNWFLSLRRGEIAVRQVIWRLVDVLPLPSSTKQRLAPHIQRENAQAQVAALRSARATLTGQEVTHNSPELPFLKTATNELFVVDALLDPHVAGHITIAVMVGVILIFGNGIIEKSGLYGKDRPGLNQKSGVDMTIEVGAPLPQVMSASELTVPQMVTPLPSAAPPYLFYHRIRVSDTLGVIATEYNISPRVLFWANGLQNGRVFIVGSTLRIPRLPGVSHTVAETETIASIAEQYGVKTTAITLFRPNRVLQNEDLVVDKEIFIPYVVPAYPDAIINKYGGEEGVATMEAIETVTVLQDETNVRNGPGRAFDKIATARLGQRLIPIARYGSWVKLELNPGEIGWIKGSLLGMSDGLVGGLPTATNVPWPPPRWTWPTTGKLTSPFGWRSVPMYMFHNGIDFANAAGTPIYAARYGRVFEAGWCSGFGYCVRIDHGGGVISIYGHMLKKPVVQVGNIVDMGDLIGLMGSTYDAAGGGFSTGVHLHLTIKVNGKYVDPLKYLP
ncbi:MAG: LysM peptidoglycan-binding domain-containing protein [Chloroflexi bacterium]|nr:MAG: LysM peptidoglycan-binding domain-containing protein [Chloroflexota bacterium]